MSLLFAIVKNLLGIFAVLCLLCVAYLAIARTMRCRKRAGRLAKTKRPRVGFFHPFCDDGGGGERVLWCAVQGLQSLRPEVDIVIYTGPSKDPENILKRVKQRFNINIKDENVQFVTLHTRAWIEPQHYPYLTILFQSLGGAVVGWEACSKVYPDLFIDSMGWAFSYPIVRLFGDARISCYTHYPTVSTDMLKAVSSGKVAHNNRSRNVIFTHLKLVYYRLFSVLYAWCGRFSEVTMVNSSWTAGHVSEIWKLPRICRPPECVNPRATPRQVAIIYPACNTDELQSTPLGNRDERLVISIGQFRPEKNHRLQLEAVAELIAKDRNRFGNVQLKLIGSARHEDDRQRVAALKRAVTELGLEKNVEFVVNASFEKLRELLGVATCGLHTMWMEHFGIGVVEFMAAGVIPIAHDSGGPRADIVTPERTGYLATTKEQYADAIESVMSLSADDRTALQKAGRLSVQRFSDETFQKRFTSLLEPLLPIQ